jgi:hypothetical protein
MHDCRALCFDRPDAVRSVAARDHRDRTGDLSLPALDLPMALLQLERGGLERAPKGVLLAVGNDEGDHDLKRSVGVDIGHPAANGLHGLTDKHGDDAGGLAAHRVKAEAGVMHGVGRVI